MHKHKWVTLDIEEPEKLTAEQNASVAEFLARRAKFRAVLRAEEKAEKSERMRAESERWRFD